jgi:hypothetical protein
MSTEFQKQEFLANIFTDVNQVNLKLVYVDMADGDLAAGLLLSQIVYWHLPSRETGRTKLRVKKNGHLWLAKRRTDWYDECRISAKQYDRAIKILEKNQLVEVENFMFKHPESKMPARTPHVRILWDTFILQHKGIMNEQYQKAMEKEENESYPQDENEDIHNESMNEPYSPNVLPRKGKTYLPKGKERISPKGKNVLPQRGKTITETLNKDYPYRESIHLLEEEGAPLSKIKNLTFKNQFSESEIKAAFRFIAPQMNETINELIRDYQVNNEHIQRLLCYMHQAGIKYISVSDYMTKNNEIAKNNGKDKRGNKIIDPAFYIINGIFIVRRNQDSDHNSYKAEQAKKQQKKKEEEEKQTTFTPTVPFYNWLDADKKEEKKEEEFLLYR